MLVHPSSESLAVKTLNRICNNLVSGSPLTRSTAKNIPLEPGSGLRRTVPDTDVSTPFPCTCSLLRGPPIGRGPVILRPGDCISTRLAEPTCGVSGEIYQIVSKLIFHLRTHDLAARLPFDQSRGCTSLPESARGDDQIRKGWSSSHLC